MTEIDAVMEIQHFFAQSISVIDFQAEPTILVGLAYVWQRNHQWDEDFTATVIAMLIGNVNPLIDRPHDEDLYTNPF